MNTFFRNSFIRKHLQNFVILCALICIAIPSVTQAEASKAKPANPTDKQIHSYLKKHHLHAKKTASGLYYVVAKQGDGVQAVAGKKLTMNYTGKLLNDTIFDSNIIARFMHVQPFTFTLGQGQVIKGWDEGVALFKKGGKGTLIIPAELAYGSRSMGKIAANSILVFDIEVVDVQ